MALCYLLDENLRGPLWRAIQQHNANGVDVIDVLQVGDPPAPPLRAPDPDLLLWAEAHNRILVTLDVNIMPGHLAAHLQAGRHSPGVLLVHGNWTIVAVRDALVLYAHAADPQTLVDLAQFIP